MNYADGVKLWFWKKKFVDVSILGRDGMFGDGAFPTEGALIFSLWLVLGSC